MASNKEDKELSPAPTPTPRKVSSVPSSLWSLLTSVPNQNVRYSSPLVAAEYVYTPELTPVPVPDSPVGRQRTNISIQWREPNPGECSSIYPWYYGEDNVNSTAEVEKQRSRDVEMIDPLEVDDDATITDENVYVDIKLNRLPVGLKLEDIQDPDERAKFQKRMDVASSTAFLVQSLDNEQVMWFLNEIKVRSTKLVWEPPSCPGCKTDNKAQGGAIMRYLDWNKIQFAEAETQVAFRVEDIIRDAYVTGATDYPVDENDPDQAVDAYAVSFNKPIGRINF